MTQEPMQHLGFNHVALVARDVAETVAALTRAFRPDDIAHAPVNARGELIRQPVAA